MKNKKTALIASAAIIGLMAVGCSTNPEDRATYAVVVAPATETSTETSINVSDSNRSAEACFEAGGLTWEWRGSRAWRTQTPSCTFVNPDHPLVEALMSLNAENGR